MSAELWALAQSELTPKQLEAFRLFAHGYGLRRIGLVLGITRDSARDRLERARLKLEAGLHGQEADG